MARFIHSADWQLGMTRHFLHGEAQSRFTQDRFDTIVQIGDVAREHAADFVVVAGDVFEHNRLDRRTVVRALDALSRIAVPVYLLPGNHDTLDAASIYDTPTFRQQCPGHVHIVRDSDPIPVAAGVVLIGAPWRSKRPLIDLVGAAVEDVVADGTVRIVVGHGAVDELNPDRDDPASIRIEPLERQIAAGAVHYVALGDRHGYTQVRPRIWYSGAHVATDYRDFQQTEPNHVLLVDADTEQCKVEPIAVGCWHFLRKQYRVDSSTDLDVIEADLDAIPDKQRTVLKAGFEGSLDMALSARLDSVERHAGDLLAAYTRWNRNTDLAVTPSDADLGAMELHGFAASAFQRLLELATASGPRQQAAQDGLSLIYRFSEANRK